MKIGDWVLVRMEGSKTHRFSGEILEMGRPRDTLLVRSSSGDVLVMQSWVKNVSNSAPKGHQALTKMQTLSRMRQITKN